jgi:CHAT domain-containing protein/tetratricopeptide (TPR) repeat protein
LKTLANPFLLQVATEMVYKEVNKFSEHFGMLWTHMDTTFTGSKATGNCPCDSLRRSVHSGFFLWMSLLILVPTISIDTRGDTLLAASTSQQPAETGDAAAQKNNDIRALEPGKSVERELAGGKAHSYQLILASGQYIHLVVDQQGIDVAVTVFGPDGKRLNEVNSSSGMQGPELVPVIAEATGSYRFEVRPVNKSAIAGRYGAKVTELRAATLRDSQRIAAIKALKEGEELYAQNTSESLRGAMDKFEEALGLTRAVGDARQEAEALHNIGGTYNELDNRQKALDYLNRALSLRRVAADRQGEASTLSYTGSVYDDLGEKQKALDYLNRALLVRREVGDRFGEAITLNNIGRIYDDLGEKQRALDYHNRALPLRRAVGNRSGEATTLNNIGMVHDSLGEKQKALEHFNQAILIWRELKNRSGEAVTLHNIGRVYNDLGDQQKALAYYNQALPLIRAASNRSREATLLNSMGLAYDPLGERQRALDYYEQSISLSRAVGDQRREAETLYNVARLKRDWGKLPEALNHIEAALATVEFLRAKLASPQLRASYFASVQKYHEFNIDLLMRLHKLHPSEGFESLAIQSSEKARARSFLELLTEARAEIRQGVDPSLVERERSLQQVIAAKAERQTRLLSGKYTPEQSVAAAKEISELTTEYDQVQAQIRQTSPRYSALTQPVPLGLKEIQTQVLDDETLLLEYALGEDKSFLWAVIPTSIHSFELPKRVDIETAARHLYEILTARNRLMPNETPEQKRQRLDRSDAEYPKASMTLSQMLLGPVASQLGTKRLLIVGEGMLQYIPFAALPKPVASGQGSAVSASDSQKRVKNQQAALVQRSAATDYRPLIVDHEVISLPSASVLAVLRRETAGRKSASKLVAVLADPVFQRDDPRLGQSSQSQVAAVEEASSLADVKRSATQSGLADLVRLRFSRYEADQITRLAPESQRMKALDFAASRATANSTDLGQYGIVHFATHGLINNQHPELSGIVLSLVDQKGRLQNGFLRLYDIYNLKLQADLVVLSACQTALGKEVKGEGLVGLTRGFMYAGAPRVVASLWQVDDRATAELMRRFYHGMLEERLSPAAALRAAQVAMWKEKRWPAPHYWAGFTLQGEWK